jgi:hypothetical protein
MMALPLKKALLTAVLTAIGTIFTAPSIFAVVQISPPFKEVVLDKDQPQATFELKVKNDTSSPQTFRVSVQDFGSLDETGGVAFLGSKANDLEYKYSLAGWLVPGADTVNLAPGDSKTISVTIENRPSLSPGGHYAAILLTSQPPPDGASRPKVIINQVLSSLVLVKKIGGERYDLALDRLSVKRSLVSLPGQVTLRFHNIGNIHAVPRGVIELKDPRGRLVKRATINQESGWVLPESFRVYEAKLSQVSRPVWPGFFRLEVQYRHDQESTFRTQSLRVFYLGRLGIGLLGVLAVLVVLVAFLLFRRRLKLR